MKIEAEACPKCGATPRGPFYHKNEYITGGCGFYDLEKKSGEHLHFYCACGWDWTVPCLDQQESP